MTRWANSENEAGLLEMAHDRTATRLTTAIAGYFAGDETDEERDQRLHDNQSVTSYTDPDGMLIIRVALSPNVGKHVVAAVETVVQQLAATPFDEPSENLGEADDASADASDRQKVTIETTQCARNASADAHLTSTIGGPNMHEQLRQLKRQWQPRR